MSPRPQSATLAHTLLAALACISSPGSSAAPPFSGTIFIDPDIITPSDPSTFQSLTHTGTARRQMYDRRVPGWVTLDAFLFEATFSDSPSSVEVQVNPEFATAANARATAEKYLPAIGQLPAALRRDLQSVWLHRGANPFGGGNNNLLIHDGQGDRYIRDGILEETFVHEASHTSLDSDHASAPGWLAAQSADPDFISTYARDNPTREDVAETFLCYLALRHRSDRISLNLAQTIRQTIPQRIAYFDRLDLDLHPLVPRRAIEITALAFDPTTSTTTLTWTSHPGASYTLESSADLHDWQPVATDIAAAAGPTTSWTSILDPAPPTTLLLRVRKQ